MARNLVIVRAGDGSLHPSWLGNGQPRDWDIIVNYFGDDPSAFRADNVRRIDSKGPKWPALCELAGHLEAQLDQYDYIWLPDDDLACDITAIDRMFAICSEFNLELAQPALSPDSYFSHVITLRNRAFRLRYTTFVEIMAPCFSRALFKSCWREFGINQSGWGLDFLWPTKVKTPLKIAIIDSAVVRHTRPVGGPNYQALKSGAKPSDELNQLMEKERLGTVQMTVGGVDHKNQLHTLGNGGYHQLMQSILAGYLPELVNHPEKLYAQISPITDALIRAVLEGKVTAKTGS